jgi:hypothetical protein
MRHGKERDPRPNKSDIRKAGQKNTYRPNSDTAGTAKNPGASYKNSAPVKKIGTPFKFQEVQRPPAGW